MAHQELQVVRGHIGLEVDSMDCSTCFVCICTKSKRLVQ